MQTESALGASRPGLAKVPSGLRKLSLAMLATERVGEAFGGLPDKTLPGRVLAAFKAAASVLGYSARVIHAVDWLFSFTQPQDWTEGSRPVVWPSAGFQREALGIGKTQAKAINRHLAELGLVVMRDSPNGKRYGRRDPQGRIVEAYGFDLSPLAARLAEFQAIAAKAREEREQTRHLRRRATIAVRGLDQVLETAAELGFAGLEWGRLGQEARMLAASIRRAQRVEEIALSVAALERRHAEAKKRLEDMSLEQSKAHSEGVDSDPKGAENRPHQYNYKTNLHHQDENVLASEECSSDGEVRAYLAPSAPAGRPGKGSNRPTRTDSGPLMRLTTDELARLAPRLRTYLRTPTPSWPEVVDAADWLRHDLGVSKPLWGEACLAMGREQAAIALAIVSTKPEGHFTSGPGRYFYGMVVRAKAGNLNLARTIWGLRSKQDGARGPKGY